MFTHDIVLKVITLKCRRIYVNWIKISEDMGKSKISAIYFEKHFKSLRHGLHMAQYILNSLSYYER